MALHSQKASAWLPPCTSCFGTTSQRRCATRRDICSIPCLILHLVKHVEHTFNPQQNPSYSQRMNTMPLFHAVESLDKFFADINNNASSDLSKTTSSSLNTTYSSNGGADGNASCYASDNTQASTSYPSRARSRLSVSKQAAALAKLSVRSSLLHKAQAIMTISLVRIVQWMQALSAAGYPVPDRLQTEVALVKGCLIQL